MPPACKRGGRTTAGRGRCGHAVERGSAKNWCSHLRAYVRLIDRRYLVPRTNAELGFGRRVCLPTESKAVMLTAGHLERVTCPYVAVSLKLQRGRTRRPW